VLLRYQLEWQRARAVADTAPSDPEAIIWLGRRTAYLGRYREAIDVFTAGVERHPNDARMFRHRGHRFITTRQFDMAIADFNRAVQLIAGRADEVEPDGQPNARNVPTSTLQFNVWYHLGLAQYLKADFAKAAEAYEQALSVSRNPDAQVATRYWYYLTLRRLNRAADGRALLDSISRRMDVMENQAYHRLLLFYKGELPADSVAGGGGSVAAGVRDATVGYGLGAWHLVNGREKEAADAFKAVVAGGSWAAFGHIAAEAELARAR
jgi:tetratricopeptide (TPR) repeat protein